MRTFTGEAIGGRSRVLDNWQRALIMLVDGGQTDGLDSMVGATGCEDIESEIRLVGRLWSGGWRCWNRERVVRSRTRLFQHGVLLERLETTSAGDTVVE